MSSHDVYTYFQDLCRSCPKMTGSIKRLLCPAEVANEGTLAMPGFWK